MNTMLGRMIKGAIVGAIASKVIGIASDKLVDGADVVADKIRNSEKIKEIKNDFKLRKMGVRTVSYKEVID